MKPDIDYTLYLCTDRNIMTTETIEESVELAIKGGVSVVQLREKECSSREFYEMAKAVKTITRMAFIWDKVICHLMQPEIS